MSAGLAVLIGAVAGIVLMTASLCAYYEIVDRRRKR